MVKESNSVRTEKKWSSNHYGELTEWTVIHEQSNQVVCIDKNDSMYIKSNTELFDTELEAAANYFEKCFNDVAKAHEKCNAAKSNLDKLRAVTT